MRILHESNSYVHHVEPCCGIKDACMHHERGRIAGRSSSQQLAIELRTPWRRHSEWFPVGICCTGDPPKCSKPLPQHRYNAPSMHGLVGMRESWRSVTGCWTDQGEWVHCSTEETGSGRGCGTRRKCEEHAHTRTLNLTCRVRRSGPT